MFQLKRKIATWDKLSVVTKTDVSQFATYEEALATLTKEVHLFSKTITNLHSYSLLIDDLSVPSTPIRLNSFFHHD